MNQVEIDLTRQGDRSAVFPLASLAHRYRSLYLAWVRRSWQPTKVEVYPLPLQQPLPTIAPSPIVIFGWMMALAPMNTSLN